MAYSGQSGSGAADAARQGLAQNRAATEQQITAATYSDAANRRITELQNTLKLAGDQLDAKAKNALQLQIAQLQDATDRMQIGEGGRQFDTGMAEKIREYGLDYALQQAGMAASGSAASAAAAERAREFDANLGLDTRKQTFAEQSYTQDQNSGGVLGLLQRWAQAAGQ
jgi:hypothetical protein